MDVSNPYQPWPFKPRKWQSEALPAIVDALGDRPVCRAVMGAGKSVVIAELCRQYDGKVVVTTPTQKLVQELSETIGEVCYSVGKYYAKAKSTHADVIVCCNMSLPSLHNTGALEGRAWIADECHRTECDTIHDVLEEWEPVWRVGFTATPCRGDRTESLQLFEKLAYNYGPWDAIRDGVIVPYSVQHPPPPVGDVNEECVRWIRRQQGVGVADAISIRDAQSFRDELKSCGIRAAVVHSQMGEAAIAETIDRLEREEIKCIVQVDLLSEGVDMPWLRWIVCRRPTSSRVRFAQYVGRGLRSYPDKTVCPVFDPHDLFHELSIDPETVLGGSEVDEPDDAEEYALKLDFLLEDAKARARSLGKKLDGAPDVILDPAASWVRRVSQDWKAAGVLPMRMPDSVIRREPVSDSQLDTLRTLIGTPDRVDVPESQKRALRIAIRAVLSRSDATNKGIDWGVASDLIQILRKLRDVGEWCGGEVEMSSGQQQRMAV